MTIKSVCLLGNGQLGRMLRQAGEPLGISVFPVGADAKPESIPYQHSVITAEIERWPETELTEKLASHSHFVNKAVFPIIADRLTQKQLFDSLSLPTATWRELNSPNELNSLFAALGDLLIIKRRIGGYDGRGQWRLKLNQISELPTDVYQHAIAEQAICFDKEMSLIGARNRAGETVFYPLTDNLHQDGILKMSVVIPSQLKQLQSKAENMLSKIMHHLNYIGVMAMECFVIGDELLINELAPRVHNSGHWTQNGASISQFELHLRAILDLPLNKPAVFAPSVMVNLIGTELNDNWLAINLVHLHWYEKEVKLGRKVGHLNLTHSSQQMLRESLDALACLLPKDDYLAALNWAKQLLS